MRIGVNLGFLRPTPVGGSEVYLRELLRCLARVSDARVTAFCWEQTAPSLADDAAIRVMPMASGSFNQARRLATENFLLAQALRKAPVDVLFCPANFAAPLLPVRVPQVATVHDLQHVHFPTHFNAVQRALRALLFRATFSRCRRIIAISDFTRRDIMSVYGVPSDRIVTVLEGVVRHSPPPTEARERVRSRYRLPDTYFYYPAAFGLHKNHGILLDALALLDKQPGGDVHLILTGDKTAHYPAFERTAQSLGLASRVRHLGFLPREDVFPVLASARGLVFPSRFEGFGLPVLEAMQCDVPVIAAATTSVPEVAGDAAILLSPDDAPAWASAMSTVLCDEDERRGLIERGRANVQRFSWDRCAKETFSVLEDAVRRRKSTACG